MYARSASLESASVSVDATTDTASALNRFLASVERRALRMAQTALRDPDDALDVLQDTFYCFIRAYRHKDPAQWPALFQRVLQNKLLDQHRRRQRGYRRFLWRSPLAEDATDDGEWLENIPDLAAEEPLEALTRADASQRLLATLAQLPLRQQQAFFLRAWEGFDTARTAEVMGCTEGSVKTHLFRATQKLRAVLEAES